MAIQNIVRYEIIDELLGSIKSVEDLCGAEG
jgi:hypothetical protein